jgi:hypothetical protein
MPFVPPIVRRYPGAALAVALLGVGLLIFGLVWFEPQKLLIEDRVDEAVPGSAANTEDAAAAEEGGDPPAQGGPGVLARGRFVSLEHQTSGRAVILEADGGRLFLRFEGFETSNGPDLVVYLSAKTPSGPDDWHGYDQEFVDLGELKGNVGDQNYLLPKGVDLDRYSTAVVWCRRFTVGFAAAPLDVV